MSLADLIESDLDDVFLSQDDFAESIDYWPKDKGKRTIVATRMGSTRSNQNEAHHLEQQEEVIFLVKKHATEGMLDPQLGDAIRLATDAKDARWDFAGIIDSDLVSFNVKFRRSTLLRAGQFKPAGL